MAAASSSASGHSPRRRARSRAAPMSRLGTPLASIATASASRISSTLTGIASEAMLASRVVNRRADDLAAAQKRAQVRGIPHIVDHQQAGPLLQLLRRAETRHPPHRRTRAARRSAPRRW